MSKLKHSIGEVVSKRSSCHGGYVIDPLAIPRSPERIVVIDRLVLASGQYFFS
jgi:hypothetical protein